MTKLFHRAARRTAAGAALALVATGTALVAAPAGAANDMLTYSCDSPQLTGDPYVVPAAIDTNAPPTLASGSSATITTTAALTLPAGLANELRGFGVTSVDGNATAQLTVDGVQRQTNLTIPSTAVPPTIGTTITVVGSGPSGSITGGAAGTSIVLGAGGFTANLTGRNAGGVVNTYVLTCTPLQPENLRVVDTVSVVKAPTTVTLTVLEPPVEYGEQATVTAVVASTASNKKPDGTVEFTFGGTTIKVEVKGGKATAIFPPALDLGMQQVTAVFTPTDPNLAPSTATRNFRVVRDQTTTEAAAVYRALRDRLVAKAKVFADHDTEVSGSVRFVLKRNGVKIRTATKLLNEFDKAKKVFRNVDKRGQYTVVARYLGSDTLKRSVDRAKLKI
ncbi:MAG TPA: Ig-like domain-containing protein [Nocardioides sp.]|nr:Ig-like domain-containing protein [Nocardioides sp.]